jgi:salicylate hydroxylase
MPHIQLRVIVAGGGIAGLTAALALRRQGHAVTVVESSAWLREAGLAVAVPPNATRTLIELGIDPKRDAKAATLRTSQEYHFLSKDASPKFGENGDSQPLPWASRATATNLQGLFFLAHRIDLHNALKDKCVSPAGPGKPVEVLLSSRVVGWDPAGSIKLQGGREMHADLIVAADGIHSLAHESILGRRVPVIPSGVTTIRFLLKTEDILNDPATASVMDDGPGSFTFYVNADRSTYLLRYPCHKSAEPPFYETHRPDEKLTVP